MRCALGDRHEAHPARVERLDQLREVEQRARQPVDLVDDDDVDPARFDLRQQPLERGALQRAARDAAIVVEVDGPDVLFYLDLPYVGCEGNYGARFERADFERLADQLAGIAGRFILSINDTPLAREVFKRFQIEEVPVTYTICTASGGAARKGELIVSWPTGVQ